MIKNKVDYKQLEVVQARKNSVYLFIFSLICNIFFFKSFGVSGFALFNLFEYYLLSAIFLPALIKNQKASLFLICGGILLVFQLLLINTDNDFVRSVLIMASIFTMQLTQYLGAFQINSIRGMSEIIWFPLRIFKRWIYAGFDYLGSVFQIKSEYALIPFRTSSFFKNLLPLIWGLVIAMPVALIILFLLKADPIFADFINKIRIWRFISESAQRIFLTLILISSFAPLIFLRGESGFASPFRWLRNILFTKSIIVVVSMIALIMGIYLTVEWPYIFANVAFETDLSRFGVATYSEYVRKGFNELVIITLIIYGVLWLAELVRQKEILNNSNKFLSGLSYLLFIESFIFIASIGRRVYLYQAYHGWSLVRIYGSWMLLWITLMFITLFIRRLIKYRWINIELMFGFIMIIILGCFNAENYIVTSHPPTVNKKIDFVYLSRMSADGYNGWVKAYEFARNTLVKNSEDNRGIFNEQNRKNIAYSEAITRNLLHRYYELVMEYGSVNEQKEILNYILQELLNYNQKYLESIPYFCANDNGKNTCDDSYWKDQISMSQEAVKNIKKVQKKLNEKKLDPSQVKNYLSISPNYYQGSINGSNYYSVDNIERYHMNNFYDFNNLFYFNNIDDSDIKIESSWDRIFVWSYQRNQAYQKIIKDVKFSDLIIPRNKFTYLYNLISIESKENREFQSDISLDTPFLKY